MATHKTINQPERVTIEYKVTKGNVVKKIEIPFKLLVMGDYANREDDTSIDKREKVRIDKLNKNKFDDVIKKFKPVIKTTVKNKLSNIDNDDLSLVIPIHKRKDLDPDGLIEIIPELKERHEARKAVAALKGPLANDPKFKEKVNNMSKNIDKGE